MIKKFICKLLGYKIEPFQSPIGTKEGCGKLKCVDCDMKFICPHHMTPYRKRRIGTYND